MDAHRKLWNEQQQELRRLLSCPEDHAKAIELFLTQHAMVHTAETSETRLHSFEDEIWDGLEEDSARFVPPKFEHSIVWCFWHLTRIEDVTMNLLLAGTSQLFLQEGWCERLSIPYRDTGNGMDAADVASLSALIVLPSLRAYRLAVGRRTRAIIQGIQPADLQRKVDPARLVQVLSEGAVTESGRSVVEYWASLTGAGLLLMPPTRHTFIHLNEAARIKQKYTNR
jgi:DinB superfamily